MTRKTTSLTLGLAFPLLAAAAPDAPLSPAELSRFNLEELAEVEISSVSKRSEPLSEAAAAIYVISREDIRRSGATSLPEVLRLAPNLQVARLDSSRYAITARGFNGTAANKLQVLIDGRSVYTPLFSGVFWDAQDTLLEDIERIEIISGPGGTLWGSNAMNGVINVITRPSRDTVGSLASVFAGNDERGLSLRQGARLGEDASFRIHAKGFARDESFLAGGAGAQDHWQKGQAGFRYDRERGEDRLTVQGDIYDGTIKQPTGQDAGIGGANFLGRWKRTLADGSEVQAQAYYDRTRRHLPGVFGETLQTWDLDLQHHFHWRENHDIVWGGGYRLMQDDVENSARLAFMPAKKNLELTNFFAQDGIALTPALEFTLGARLENNRYTGLEFQPNLRLAWKLREHQLLWAAVSREVRTPSRLDRELFAPGPPAAPTLLAGGPDFKSEKLMAWRLGYRAQPGPRLSYTVTVFYHDYERLRSLEPAPGGGLPFTIGNEMAGHSYGLEAWGSYQVREDWRLSAGYTALQERLHFTAASRDTQLRNAGNDPPYQFFLRTSHTLPRHLELDLSLRAIGALPDPAVPAYVAVDGRIGWRIEPGLQLSLSANNLFDRRHVEFATTTSRNEIARSLRLQLLWTF